MEWSEYEALEYAKALEREARAWRAYAEDAYAPGAQERLDRACDTVDENLRRMNELGMRWWPRTRAELAAEQS